MEEVASEHLYLVLEVFNRFIVELTDIMYDIKEYRQYLVVSVLGNVPHMQ